MSEQNTPPVGEPPVEPVVDPAAPTPQDPFANLGPNPTEAEQFKALQDAGIISAEMEMPAGKPQEEPPVEPNAEEVNRPEWLRDEFKTEEEQGKAYNDLVKLLGKQGKVDENGKPIMPDGIQKPAPAEKPVFNAERLSELGAEWEKGEGSLSDESYEMFKGMGFEREVIDQIAAATQTAAAVGKVKSIQEAGIDPERFSAMTEWAGANWSEAQIDAFNAAYLGSDPGQRQLALTSLAGAFAASNGQGHGGSGSDLLEGGKAKSTLVPFKSQQELVEAQSVKDAQGRSRYDHDPNYRSQVDKRAALSLNS